MDTSQLINMGLTALSGAAGFMGAKFWLSHWVRQTDAKLTAQAERISDLRVDIAVDKEKNSNLAGRLDQIQVSLDQNYKSIGTIEQSLTTLWKTVERVNGLPKRLSDGPDDR